MHRTPWYFLAILFLGTIGAAAQALPQQHIVSLPKTEDSYRPITGQERLHWIATSTLGPESLAAGLLTTALATGRDTPPEYGTHWGGFGKRYGMRLTGVSTGSVIEAGLGSLWGEDPRYFRAARLSKGA